MNPDDVARYRAFAEPGSNEWALLDALEASWSALARVRELCDRWERHGKPHPDYIVGDVRAAIEGDNQ